MTLWRKLSIVSQCSGVLLSLVVGCSPRGGPPYSLSEQNPYFPIKEGNVWFYRNDMYPDRGLIIRVGKYREFCGEVFARVEMIYTQRGRARNEHLFYMRCGSAGEVIAFMHHDTLPTSAPSCKEIKDRTFLFYGSTDGPERQRGVDTRLPGVGDASDSGTVSYKDLFKLKVTARYDSVVIGGQTYMDCIEFHKTEAVDAEAWDLLVHDVGLVQQRTSGKGTYTLCGYLLN